MQYYPRSRLAPPPPPFGRGGGAGYPRGHKQLYAPPPPASLPPAPPPPQRKYEVLMEAGRLAAEYLVSQGVLPPAALQRGAGAWTAPPFPIPPPPVPQQLQETPAFYGRRRYDDDYSNNSSARPRRINGTSSSTSNRDDYSNGSYNGRGKRKYGEYRRGYSDSGRDREKERGRASSNGRRYEEDDDEDGAPGFRRERRGSRGSDELRSSVTEAVKEETPLTVKALGELDIEDVRSKIVSSIDVRKDAEVLPEVQDDNEEGEVEDDSKVLNSESEVVEQGIDTHANKASTGGVIESEPTHSPDGKVPHEAADEKTEDDEKVLDEPALDHDTYDGKATNVESNLGDDLLDYCDFARAPTRPRSVRPQRNTASVRGETSVAGAVDLVSSGQVSQMVIEESANDTSLTNTLSENGEDQICQDNTESSADCVEAMEPMHLQENGTSVLNDNMREEMGDAQVDVVQEYKEETNLSPEMAAHKDTLMQETSLSPMTACHKDRLAEEDNLMQETDISPLTASHQDSLIKETELSALTASHKDSFMQDTELCQIISSDENNLNLEFKEGTQTCDVGNNLNLEFKEGTQTCDVGMLPQDVGLMELSDQREIIDAEVCPNVGAEAVIKMEEGNLDQSSSLQVSDLDLVGGREVAATHDNPALVQSSAVGSSSEPHYKQQEDPGTTEGSNASATNDLCQLPLESKDVQVIDIDCDAPLEVGGFDSSKSKNEMICSGMDNMMHPGINPDVLPGIPDGFNIAFSDFLGTDIPCYSSMQSDLHAGISANSEGITGLDDPIYGSLTDIVFEKESFGWHLGFMDVWGQPAQDFDKFF
ncbi:hypothetical protein ACP70R_027204 [Stipagrostis hirtigluma subsp. patula]